MPIPSPNQGESHSAFMGRCMSNATMRSEYPRQDQRAAVCNSQFRSRSNQWHQVKANFRSASPTRRETLDGKEYLVVPVVMMVEGVHHGSGGPMLYLADELQMFPGAWDGRPVPVFHPEANGTQISCNAPDVIEAQTVGQLFNTMFSGGKLRSEAWIDTEKCRRISPDTLDMLEALERGERVQIEVSTGLWSEDEEVQGTWPATGERYTSIARHIRPDHLALLPGGQGACGWRDGCGVRANQRKEDGMANDGQGSESKSWLVKVATRLGLSASGKKPMPENHLVENAMSYQEITHLLQRLVDSWDGQGKIHFVRAVYDANFVYEIACENAAQSGLFRQDYSLNAESGEIDLSGEPQRVVEQRDFVAANEDGEGNEDANADEAGDTPTTVHSKEDKTMKVNDNVKAMVSGLIENDKAPFTQDDEETLLAFSECVLKNLTEQYTVSEDTADADAEPSTDDTAQAATTESEAATEAPETNEDGDAKITIKVKDLQGMVDNAVDHRIETGTKTELVKDLKANKCPLPEKELMAMSVKSLEELGQVYTPPDFSGRGTVRSHAAVGGDEAPEKMEPIAMGDFSDRLPPKHRQ